MTNPVQKSASPSTESRTRAVPYSIAIARKALVFSYPATYLPVSELATMPKEKNYNPVQAQRKADKAKAIKKGV